jgi:lipopolysaccharide transport protein LptA
MIFKTGETLNRVKAEGNPVKFVKERSAEEKEIRGQALQLDYDAQKDTLELKKDAKLWQEQDQFSGDYIRYNIQQELVHASKGGSDERVRVIIHPQNNNN